MIVCASTTGRAYCPYCGCRPEQRHANSLCNCDDACETADCPMILTATHFDHTKVPVPVFVVRCQNCNTMTNSPRKVSGYHSVCEDCEALASLPPHLR